MEEEALIRWKQEREEEERQYQRLHRKIYGDGELSPEEVVKAINERKSQRYNFVHELMSASEYSVISIAKLIRDLDLDPSRPVKADEACKALTDACVVLKNKGYAAQLPKILYKPILYYAGTGLRLSVMEAAKRTILPKHTIEQLEKMESLGTDQTN